MNSPSATVGPIEVRRGRDRYKYCVVDDLFISEWKRGIDHSRSTWSLRGTSSQFTEIVGRPNGVEKKLQRAGLLVAISVIIHFSDYNTSIPLLAPFLFLLGGWWFFNSLDGVRPHCWTQVRKITGEDAFNFLRPENGTDEWLHFERDLAQTIVRLNEAET